MCASGSFLELTTFDEIAEDLDELSLYEQLLFCSLDPDELKKRNLNPYEYYIIEKVRFNFQEYNNCTVLIRYMTGEYIEAKSMDILSGNELDDYDMRQRGIREFLKEYCEKYMDKNKDNKIYYYHDYDDATIAMM